LGVGPVFVVTEAMEPMAKRGVFIRGKGSWDFMLCVDGRQRIWVLVFVLVLDLVWDFGLILRNGRGVKVNWRFVTRP
jgi:hypothetical protein